MKSWKLLPLLAAIVTLGFGCASLEAPNTESLLTASGFVAKTPTTPKQIAFNQALPSYKLQRDTINGKTVYAYSDSEHDLVYLGNEQAYQRYKQLAIKQQIAEDDLDAAEMEQDAALDWSTWGPWSGFWD
jgi:hypothetical protein